MKEETHIKHLAPQQRHNWGLKIPKRHFLPFLINLEAAFSIIYSNVIMVPKEKEKKWR